jgi:hypothetical protein
MNRSTAAVRDTSSAAGTTHAATLGVALRELGQHLSDLQTALQQLSDLAADKLAALRRADTEALQACAAREEQLLREVFRSEPSRKAALARVAQTLLLADAARAQLNDIVARLPEPQASSWRARSVALRDIAAELQRKNRLAAGVARNLHSHIRGIFADVATAAQESVVYGPQGQHAAGCPRCWVDAVG